MAANHAVQQAPTSRPARHRGRGGQLRARLSSTQNTAYCSSRPSPGCTHQTGTHHPAVPTTIYAPPQACTRHTGRRSSSGTGSCRRPPSPACPGSAGAVGVAARARRSPRQLGPTRPQSGRRQRWPAAEPLPGRLLGFSGSASTPGRRLHVVEEAHVEWRRARECARCVAGVAASVRPPTSDGGPPLERPQRRSPARHCARRC